MKPAIIGFNAPANADKPGIVDNIDLPAKVDKATPTAEITGKNW
jgi:hypothetical protein